jgi:hypothetical protein
VLLTACSEAPAGPDREGEVVTVTVETSASFVGQRYPEVLLTIIGSGTSSRGNVVSVSSRTVDGVTVTSPVRVNEGSHTICVSVTSSAATSASTCRLVPLTWPRLGGRSVLYGPDGAVAPLGLSLTVDDDEVFPITSADGSFSIPSIKAQSVGAKLWLAASGSVAPSLVRSSPGTPINVVMFPAHLSIPSCSAYGGQLVTLDLERAYAPASMGQTSYFDRVNTIPGSGKVVVASWDMASIPVALSDTGGPGKQFSSADSAEMMTALSELTSYFCQRFHLATIPVARAGGVVVFKDPAFSALGAHSMALPATRGDYTRADVVLRTVVPTDTSMRDSTRRTVMHEFLHVLGFGHTCSWPSVMTTGTACKETFYSLVPSPQDVAHYFAMRYARQGERALPSLVSLGPAYVAALVAKGQSELHLLPYFSEP